MHTHPFKKNDKPTSCETSRIEIGGQVFEVPTTYKNDPTEDDAAAATAFQSDGYIIDQDLITQFRENLGPIRTQIVNRFPRCGY